MPDARYNEDARAFLAALGRRLRAARQGRGLTQAQLAVHSGVATAFLSQLELGYRAPTMVTMLRLARELHIEPGDLVPTFAEATTAHREPPSENLPEVTDAVPPGVADDRADGGSATPGPFPDPAPTPQSGKAKAVPEGGRTI